jgi:hypothetical protein
MGKFFYKKIYIQKLAPEDIWFLRYCRSRFFTFVFFMQKLTELAQARITKVVGYFTMNPTKLVFHFSHFSVIFYAIYKNQSELKYYLRTTL